MKKYLTPLLNWRVLVLMVLAMVAFMLILGETESITVLLSIKAIGFGLAYLTYRIGSYWGRLGLIDELEIYDANE